MCKIVVFQAQGTAIESKMCQRVDYKLSKVSVSESIVPISTCQGVGGGRGTFDDKCVRVQSVRVHCIRVQCVRVQCVRVQCVQMSEYSVS